MAAVEPQPASMPDDCRERARAALSDLGLHCERLEPLSPPSSGRKQQRHTWKATLAGGTIVKVRKLEDGGAVDALVAMRRILPAFFAPVVACHADLLVEAWIDGRTLSNDEANDRGFELGSLMGSWHRQCRQPARVALEPRRDRALAHLDELARRGRIPGQVAEALIRDLRTATVDEGTTIVHLDFCPENIVCDAQGRLHVIDNEWLRADAPGVDIGRSYARWPASEAGWARFLDGYRASSGLSSATARFWLIAMAAASAMIRIDQPAPRAELPLARLTQLATR
jgi:hypothetical protein